MRYGLIQRNFKDNEYLCKLGKEYLAHWHASFIHFFYIKFAKFWHITHISTTNHRKVINSEKQSIFGPSCIRLWFLLMNVEKMYFLHSLSRLIGWNAINCTISTKKNCKSLIFSKYVKVNIKCYLYFYILNEKVAICSFSSHCELCFMLLQGLFRVVAGVVLCCCRGCYKHVEFWTTTSGVFTYTSPTRSQLDNLPTEESIGFFML